MNVVFTKIGFAIQKV